MELLFALAIVPLAALGLGLGLLLGRGPVHTSCDGLACIRSAACETCPKRAAREKDA